MRTLFKLTLAVLIACLIACQSPAAPAATPGSTPRAPPRMTPPSPTRACSRTRVRSPIGRDPRRRPPHPASAPRSDVVGPRRRAPPGARARDRDAAPRRPRARRRRRGRAPGHARERRAVRSGRGIVVRRGTAARGASASHRVAPPRRARADRGRRPRLRDLDPHRESAFATVLTYDPSTNTWTPTADINVARAGHQAATLLDGRVLVAGGGNQVGYPCNASHPTAPSPTRSRARRSSIPCSALGRASPR